MTNEEFELEKARIIELHGIPVRDFDEKNESARLIDQLSYKLRAQKMQEGRKKKESLAELVNDVPKDELKRLIIRPTKPIYIEDKDLKQFTELEKSILQAHYEDSTLNNEQLATRFGVKRQTVTALFNSMEAKLLKIKLFEREVPDKVRLALIALLEDNNQKTVERLAEHYGIIKPSQQDINVISKPIDDPEALKMLRELGDKLANKDSENV